VKVNALMFLRYMALSRELWRSFSNKLDGKPPRSVSRALLPVVILTTDLRCHQPSDRRMKTNKVIEKKQRLEVCRTAQLYKLMNAYDNASNIYISEHNLARQCSPKENSMSASKII
jgi:hypothetical protein